MKRFCALCLTVIMVLSLLTGCNSQNADQTQGGGTTAAADSGNADKTQGGETTAAADSGSSEAGRKDYIDYDEEPYEVVIECLNLGSNMDSVPQMEAAVNAITEPAINVKVKLQVIHIADHATKTALWSAGGEKVDIFYTGTTVPFAQFVADGMIIPMTQYLDERGATIKEKMGDLLDAFKVNGEIYAIPQSIYCAGGLGFGYNADMAKQLGLTLPETWDLDSVTELGYAIKKADPSKYLTAKNGATDAGEIYYYCGLDGFGTSTAAYGVLLDPINSTTIENLYTSDIFRDYCLHNIEWKENDFMPADQAVNGENVQDIFKAENCFMTWVGSNPMEALIKQTSTSFDYKVAYTTVPLLTSAGVQEKSWGISTNCSRPDKAMDFLNFLFESPDVANILNYGIEGQDYTFVEGSDKIITYPEGVDSTNVGWSRSFCAFGDDRENYQFAPATEAYYDEIRTFNENAVAIATLGYTFDASPVSNQIASVTNVVQEYVPSLVYGEISEDKLDDYLAELNGKLEEAGILKIIEENQKQLDAWLASK